MTLDARRLETFRLDERRITGYTLGLSSYILILVKSAALVHLIPLRGIICHHSTEETSNRLCPLVKVKIDRGGGRLMQIAASSTYAGSFHILLGPHEEWRSYVRTHLMI